MVLRVYRELFTGGRLEVADEVLAADYVNHGAPPGLSPDRAGVAQVVQRLRDAYPDFVSQVDSMVEEGDLVAVRGHLTGTPTGGGPTRVELVDFFRFDAADRIAERWA
jgi:predicted SnoaL-like aldol condensation-catalyzing enzyme